ncbi:hypothetical protein E4U40_004014 [Claviceps sp. LM458 group G5]|nr:hypothetical protein E4U40_004014 [Claviceps sp. LM458 group G5]
MARRQHLTLTVLLAVVVFLSITYLFSSGASPIRRAAAPFGRDAEPISQKTTAAPPSEPNADFTLDLDAIPNLSGGDSIAPKLENATLKAELGRATWKFLHTMVAKFPDKPSDSDRKTLESFFHLFGRLYPCGDCARHFREMLKKYPPQTSTRNAAAGWLCSMHNMVNKRLKKPQFDCTKIGDFYDCGCGDDKKDKNKEKSKSEEEIDKDDGQAKDHDQVKVKREGFVEKSSAFGLDRLVQKMSKSAAGDFS